MPSLFKLLTGDRLFRWCLSLLLELVAKGGLDIPGDRLEKEASLFDGVLGCFSGECLSKRMRDVYWGDRAVGDLRGETLSQSDDLLILVVIRAH